MPEVLGNPPSPRTALFWNGTAWQWALVDTAGRLQVRGEDQLFSYEDALHDQSRGNPSGADGYRDSGSPAGNKIWHVTNLSARDENTPLTAIRFILHSGVVDYNIEEVIAAIPALEFRSYRCDLWLDPLDVIRAIFIGSLAADTCSIDILGHKMTLEV